MSLYKKECPEYLEQCLASIEKQTLLPSEIVIVFDGPISEELELVVDKWRNILVVKVVELPFNQGLGKALNAGLTYCSNELIARMDTDDICCPDRLFMQYNRFADDEELDICGTQIYEFDSRLDEGSELEKKNVPCGLNDIVEFAAYRNPMNHMTVMFKRDKILQVGGYRHHLFMEDYNLWLRCIAAGMKIENIDKPLVYARVGNGMISRRRGLLYLKSEIELLSIKMSMGKWSRMKLLLVFLFRFFARLFPVFMLKRLYSTLRMY